MLRNPGVPPGGVPPKYIAFFRPPPFMKDFHGPRVLEILPCPRVLAQKAKKMRRFLGSPFSGKTQWHGGLFGPLGRPKSLMNGGGGSLRISANLNLCAGFLIFDRFCSVLLCKCRSRQKSPMKELGADSRKNVKKSGWAEFLKKGGGVQVNFQVKS